MRWDHVIRHGKLVTPGEIYEADIYISDGKIAAISQTALPGSAALETDAAGRYVLPGLIDTHVHSRDPGATHKEDFAHSTRAAAAGGITTIFEMPNTLPPVSDANGFHRQAAHLRRQAYVNFGLWGICLGRLNVEELQGLHEAGVIGFKYFWGYAIHKRTFQLIYSDTSGAEEIIPPCHDGEVYEMFEAVAKTGNLLAVHAENNDLIQSLTAKVKREGRADYAALLEARPHLAETLAVQTGISIAKATGARLHILHVSTAEAVELIRRARMEGLPITAETCPHYLFLTKEDYDTIGPAMKIYPLVKNKEDQARLWQGISEGVITVVCSDHAPHTAEEKSGELWSVPAGSCGVETLAPLMLDAVSKGRLTLRQLVALLSENPARQYGVYPQKGALLPGSDADLTIVDCGKEAILRSEALHSKTKVSAFDGFAVKGMPVMTIVGGVIVMKDGQVIGEPVGKLVTPSSS